MSVDHIVMGSSTGASSGGAASGGTYVDDVFSTYLYTGAGGSQTINNGINFATYGGMIWCKPRNSTAAHVVIDTVRGGDSWLSTNNSAQAFPGTGNNQKIAFNTTGIVSDAVDGLNWSTSGATFSTWSFRKAPKFFDIVSYTGDGTSSKLLNHSLTVTPGMVLIKNTSVASNWGVWHVNGRGGALDGALALNLTDTPLTPSFSVSATTFRVYQGTTNFKMDPNVSGNNYIAYLFAHDTSATSMVQCGAVATNASGAITATTLGWEPQFILIKNITSAWDWEIHDVMRGWSIATNTNAIANAIKPNLTSTEGSGNTAFTMTPTGFYSNANFGANQNYIYMAIRRPNKPPTSGTQVFNVSTWTQSGGL
jgi:hypothetical protein